MNPESNPSYDDPQPACAICGQRLPGPQAACPRCDAPGASPANQDRPRDPSWLADIINLFMALLLWFLLGPICGMELGGSLPIAVWFLVIRLRRSWRHLAVRQLVNRSLVLLVIGAIQFGVVLAAFLAGCRYLLRDVP